MPPRKVEIHLQPAGHHCTVVLDGEVVQNCRRVAVGAALGELTTVTLTLHDVNVIVVGEAEVIVADAAGDTA
jgi:hypothetical protein